MQIIPAALLFLSLFHTPALAAHAGFSRPEANRCTVKDQSGSIEPWDCRDSTTGSIRCYADVEYDDGARYRVWGDGCYQSYSDCWWNGPGAVDPCD